jgi:hypothetical protein
MPITDSDRLRRRGCALAMLAAPAFAVVGHLVQATPDEHDTASELASVAAAQGRATLAAGLGFIGLVLMVPALLGLARPLWADRPRTALVGLSLSTTGLMALVALMGSAPVTVAMSASSADRAQMVALTDRYESTVLVGVWAGLMVLGYSLGPVVLGIALWRSGGSWMIPAALVAGLVLMMADAGRWPLAVGFACTWLGFAIAGAALLREPVEDRAARGRDVAVPA